MPIAPAPPVEQIPDDPIPDPEEIHDDGDGAEDDGTVSARLTHFRRPDENSVKN